MFTIPMHERFIQKREVCFLIGRGGVVLWADAAAGPLSMPDSRARFEAIWTHREELQEIAHSHPLGPLAFSWEDKTTISAIESALGRPLRWSVVAPQGMIAREGKSPAARPESEPWWAPLLRLASGMS